MSNWTTEKSNSCIKYVYHHSTYYKGWYHSFYIMKYSRDKIYTVYMNSYPCWSMEFKTLKEAKQWIETSH